MNPPSLAAVFLDYENILYHLKNEYADPPQLGDCIATILRNLRKHLQETENLDVIIFKAYADFERQAQALGALYLMRIDTHNVLGTEHKNAADMRLCIDLMEVLYTRSDIRHFILVAGDRDYIPVVQHLRRQARSVKAVAFRATLSGDLLQILGQNNLIEAGTFLSDTDKRELLIHKNKKINTMGLTVVGKIELPPDQSDRNATTNSKEPSNIDSLPKNIANKTAPLVATKQTPKATSPENISTLFPNVKRISHKPTLDALAHLMVFIKEKNINEVWLAPFLRLLTDRMPLLADYERKDLINNLRIYGAIAIEKRTGDSYDYSVICINYNHLDVVAAIVE